MAQAGLLVQVDGSRHAWLEDSGPRLTLVGGIDDATGTLTGATFRDEEDTAGYLVVLRDTVRRHGVPGAWYRDRHGIFETPEKMALTLEEQLADTRTPTQLGRALAELGIGSIAARSPCRDPNVYAMRCSSSSVPMPNSATSKGVPGTVTCSRSSRRA